MDKERRARAQGGKRDPQVDLIFLPADAGNMSPDRLAELRLCATFRSVQKDRSKNASISRRTSPRKYEVFKFRPF